MPLYRRKNSPFWWADINIPGYARLRLSTNQTDREQAQKAHDLFRAELWATPRQKDAPRPERLSRVILQWCNAEHRGVPDIQAIRKFLRACGDRLVADAAADRDGIDRALRSFVTTPGNYTRYRNRLHAVFQLAVDEGLISSVPQLRKWEVARSPPHRWLRPEQLRTLLGELAEHQRPMVLFAVHTGLRQTNVLGLTWDCVDLAKGIAWAHAHTTKGNKTISVPLNDTALAVLRAQQGKHPQFVFVYRGRPISEIKTAFQKACVRAGLGEFTHTDSGRHYSGLRWHDLRHTFASWHAQRGTPPQVIKELGGWASMQMVERYMHLSPSFMASFANNTTEEK